MIEKRVNVEPRYTLLACIAAVGATLTVAAPAGADPQSYVDYIRSHDGVVLQSDANLIVGGFSICDEIRAGVPIDKVREHYSHWAVPSSAVDAAMKELC